MEKWFNKKITEFESWVKAAFSLDNLEQIKEQCLSICDSVCWLNEDKICQEDVEFLTNCGLDKEHILCYQYYMKDKSVKFYQVEYAFFQSVCY